MPEKNDNQTGADHTSADAANEDRPETEAPENHRQRAHRMEEQIGKREARKLKARREQNRSVWFGLGMFGMIGWSVAVPTLIGVALGYWIDRQWPTRYSWTLMLMLLGVALGCLNAWLWVQRESRHD